MEPGPYLLALKSMATIEQALTELLALPLAARETPNARRNLILSHEG